MTTHFHLFVYGSLKADGSAADLMRGCDLVGEATVAGALYDIDGRFPALVLAGPGTVHGEIWRCPVDRLRVLDAYEGTEDGLFRRVGVESEGRGCWTYVAGAALAARLTAAGRIESGTWGRPA